MSNAITASQSVAEREARRVVTRHATVVDEVDAIINSILSDDALLSQWVIHNNPVFDIDSTEGSVAIDKVRLADMVKAYAEANGERFPLTRAATTHRVQQCVQAALRRTDESVNQRRAAIKAQAQTPGAAPEAA